METENMELRLMCMSDLPAVSRIIDAHDDDDAEAAEEDYHDTGLDHQFVLEADSKVIGVTGYRPVEATDHTAWLSWTYLDKPHQGKGIGKRMINDVLGKLRDIGGRKVFVKLSDYEAPENGNIYEQALHAYKAVGFEEELISYDFYDDGENQIMLGLCIYTPDPEAEDVEVSVQEEKPVIRFNGLYEIAETEGAYTFNWTVTKKSLFGKRSFSVLDLKTGLQAVKDQGGRRVFLTFPSNLPLIHNPLQSAGFKYVGRLGDYYERGVHELHFTHDLENL